MELTDEQMRASNALIKYVHAPHTSYVAMAGYAGTGKTTVMGVTAKRLIEDLKGIRIAYLAPTGKAALVLATKLGKSGAINADSYWGTIHSLIYTPRKTQGGGVEWQLVDDVPYDLLVIDEASMIQRNIFDDLVTFNKPMIFIGDSGQLPPVNDSLFEPLQNTDIVLNTVHRQALDNPIVRVATDVRLGKQAPFGVIDGKYARFRRNSKEAFKVIHGFLNSVGDDNTAILCGTNKTRVIYNKKVREVRGFYSAGGTFPVEGERMVCLKNDQSTMFRNGQLLRVKQTTFDVPNTEEAYMVEFEDWPGRNLAAMSPALNAPAIQEVLTAHHHVEPKLKRVLNTTGQKELLVCDYGYALSVHKAQGSEWERVLLINERTSYMTDDDYRRWLYTGITRASQKIAIVG